MPEYAIVEQASPGFVYIRTDRDVFFEKGYCTGNTYQFSWGDYYDIDIYENPQTGEVQGVINRLSYSTTPSDYL